MPPAKERTKSKLPAAADVKGKKRAIDQDEDLDVDAFVRKQVKALNAPLKTLDRAQYYTEDPNGVETQPPLQMILDKAVKALSQQLEEKRRRKHADASIRAIVEQVEYLKEEQAARSGSPELDEDGRIRVDREEWLEELPDNWPSEADADQDDIDEYRKLLEEVRELEAQKSLLKQKEAHYSDLARIVTEELDVGKLAKFLQGGGTAKIQKGV